MSNRIGANEIGINSDYKKYLGQTLAIETRLGKELEIRIASAWKTFWIQKLHNIKA